MHALSEGILTDASVLFFWCNNCILRKVKLPIVELSLKHILESSNSTGNFLSPVDDSNKNLTVSSFYFSKLLLLTSSVKKEKS